MEKLPGCHHQSDRRKKRIANASMGAALRDWMALAVEPAWKATLNGGGGWTLSVGCEKHAYHFHARVAMITSRTMEHSDGN